MLGLTLDQTIAVSIVVIMLGLFIWDRWRYDVVAVSALLAGTLSGVIPADTAFSGFSDQVIVVIAAVLVVSKAIARSGLLDRAARRLLSRVDTPSAQIGVLSMAVALMSAFVKNVGTLGIFIPVAMQVARRSKQSASIYLMPLAFASLIGGTITQIGTSPNLLISSVREDLVGEGFRLFDYAWVGLPLTLMAVAFLSVGWRLLPKDRKGRPSAEERFSIADYTTEMSIGADSPLVGRTVGALEAIAGAGAVIVAILRSGHHIHIPGAQWPLEAGDVVTVQADSEGIKALVDEGKLALVHAQDLASDDDRDLLQTVEAVVTPDSPMVGRTAKNLYLRRRHDVNVLAISRAGQRRALNLQSQAFQPGDVVVLQGWANSIDTTMSELGLLPLADRNLALQAPSKGVVSLLVLAIAMVLIAFKVVTVAVGFFAAAVLVVVFNQVSLKDAYEAIEGPILVMLAALIPVAESLKTTGVTDVLAKTMAVAGAQVPPYGALAMMIAAAMLLTPFLNNAAAVLMLGPVAGALAKDLGYNPDPFLMGVALGCACDFLTPIGHQNNLLVMGPGGYRFGDYWRLGLPLSLTVLAAGTLLIGYFWPLVATGAT